ncbi:apolipoprotein C-II isoform X1 [Cavia porcellus]|uniref:Apolipoprotein C-II n=1 Tax=Cavia porcellus TaxID=10141 RepID=APOC2_CAVPO|nr:apolipoprotein C-II precursor [Cavia porcellus]XP_013002235.1 apolipoprotein C-II isoform X1 [Cavia porcellus]P27916.1 RecName: Full=Apolipoprotein C-II; Short=Apo-CII; Short=ApoC-II; AltName: Full=Apolipoprotein C2; Contains: RecName: Full=Proapolipoprotein C-II; Short=ProapoC-II; Flags: Precursor [Cavia porcellus]AAA37031.1 apolipoprotein C-II [Cavia porcellus]
MDARSLLLLWLLLPLLLLLGCEVQGAHLTQQDEPTSPDLLETLSTYWDSAKAAAQGLYNNTYLPAVDETIRDIYSKGSAAISTYTGILTDQILTMLQGKQ